MYDALAVPLVPAVAGAGEFVPALAAAGDDDCVVSAISDLAFVSMKRSAAGGVALGLESGRSFVAGAAVPLVPTVPLMSLPRCRQPINTTLSPVALVPVAPGAPLAADVAGAGVCAGSLVDVFSLRPHANDSAATHPMQSTRFI
jgi:hypothetical protein